MQDKRQAAPRIETNIKAHYLDSIIPVSSCIFNLSTGGVFIQTNHPLPVDSTLYMRFRLPDEDESLHIRGRVVWVKRIANSFPSGMGIQFTEMTPMTKLRIQFFIENHAAKMSAVA